jgi:hypothetical protein
VAQLAAAVGVIASLFYLAAQIRQNTRSMRAIVVDSLAHSIVDLLGSMAQQPESVRAFAAVVQDWERASDEERLSVSVVGYQFKRLSPICRQKGETLWDYRELVTASGSMAVTPI